MIGGRRMLVANLLLAVATLFACGDEGSDAVAQKSAGVTLEAPDGDGCTLTQGYWKNHEESWPVTYLDIGGARYAQDDLIGIFEAPPRRDASLILAHQMIAALLNIASGANALELGGTLAAADAWMTANRDGDGRLPYGVRRGAAADEAIDLAGVLADFNEGGIGPGHCDDGPGTGNGDPGGQGGGSYGAGGGSYGAGGGSYGAGGCDQGGDGGDGGDPGGDGGAPGAQCAQPCAGFGECLGDFVCRDGCCTAPVN